jgi:hypothetical protein
VQADELEFREFPQTEVSFSGSPGRKSVSQDERRNLPDRVRPGVKYRKVQVDYRLATKLADDEVGGETSRGASGAPEPPKAGPQAPE